MVTREFVTDAYGVEQPLERMVESSQVHGAKETMEYLVLQQVYTRTQPGPWKVWGTTEETSVEVLERREKKAMEEKVRRKGAAGAEGGRAAV